jgi:hypothetical protein
MNMLMLQNFEVVSGIFNTDTDYKASLCGGVM